MPPQPTVGADDFLIRDRFDTGLWEGGAVYEAGRFAHCYAIRMYDQQTSLSVFVGSRGLIVTVARDDWRLPESDSYRATLRIDQRWRATAVALSSNDGSLVVPVDDLRFIDAFVAGNLLHVGRPGGAGEVAMSLSGSRVALARVSDCLDRHDDL